MRWLEHRIPPPLAGGLASVAMWFIARATGGLALDQGLRILVAALLAAAGVAFALAGGQAFRRAQTTVNPLKPEAASSLVVVGVYRHTRNPMYVGFACMLLGWAVYLAAPLALLGPVLFVAFITRFQILPEERALAEKFGPEFEAYRQKVRRWL